MAGFDEFQVTESVTSLAALSPADSIACNCVVSPAATEETSATIKIAPDGLLEPPPPQPARDETARVTSSRRQELNSEQEDLGLSTCDHP